MKPIEEIANNYIGTSDQGAYINALQIKRGLSPPLNLLSTVGKRVIGNAQNTVCTLCNYICNGRLYAALSWNAKGF